MFRGALGSILFSSAPAIGLLGAFPGALGSILFSSAPAIGLLGAFQGALGSILFSSAPAIGLLGAFPGAPGSILFSSAPAIGLLGAFQGAQRSILFSSAPAGGLHPTAHYPSQAKRRPVKPTAKTDACSMLISCFFCAHFALIPCLFLAFLRVSCSYSTVTDLARFLGLSMSHLFFLAT